jgi:hypothetical protein
MKSKRKISRLEAERHRACRAEISISQKIMRALGARNINFPRLNRLQVEYRAAIDRISTAETELHDYRVRQEIAVFIASFFAPSPTPA